MVRAPYLIAEPQRFKTLEKLAPKKVFKRSHFENKLQLIAKASFSTFVSKTIKLAIPDHWTLQDRSSGGWPVPGDALREPQPEEIREPIFLS